MKLKEGFILRQIAGDTVVLPSGDLNINAMITLNHTGAFLWQKMEQEVSAEELEQALIAEYSIDLETARKAVASFVAQLEKNEFLA